MALQLLGKPRLLKDLNYRAVVELLVQEGSQSRVEIAEKLTLSRPSVSRIVEALLQSRLIIEGEKVASKMGRRQTLLDINPSAGVVAGIDLRAGKTCVVLADLTGAILAKQEVKTDLASVTAVLTQLVSLTQGLYLSLNLEQPLIAVSVGLSAAWDQTAKRVHSAPNLKVLEGENLLERLREMFGADTALAVDNDVNYAALGESVYGAARDYADFFYLSLGSGVGGGAIIHNRLHRGVQGFAGELGYLPVAVNGNYRALEELVSYKAILERAPRIGGTRDLGRYLQTCGADGLHRDVLQDLSFHTALALSAIVMVLNPALIVIGGSLGRQFQGLLPQITSALETLLPVRPRLEITELGDDAPLRGAVVQAMENARELLIARKLA